MNRWIRLGAVAFAALVFAGWSVAQEPVYQLSTHMLDLSQGAPAAGVTVTLYRQASDGSWTRLCERTTDRNGRIGDLLPQAGPGANRGLYKLKFETEPYFAAQGLRSIYPFVEVVFRIEGDGHYHIPITMSANGYSTYRGN